MKLNLNVEDGNNTIYIEADDNEYMVGWLSAKLGHYIQPVGSPTFIDKVTGEPNGCVSMYVEGMGFEQEALHYDRFGDVFVHELVTQIKAYGHKLTHLYEVVLVGVLGKWRVKIRGVWDDTA